MPALRRLVTMGLLSAVGVSAPLASASAEETILIYLRTTQTVSHRAASEGGTAVTDSSRAQVMIALGDHRVALYEPGDVWLYDFAKRRVQRVDSRRETYSDWSLYAFVAFNEMELERRLDLRSRLMAERSGSGPSVFDLEALFSMDTAARVGRGESLADSSTAARTRFFTNQQLSVDMVPTDTMFAPGRAATFGRFLALQAHLHPDARRAMVESGKVPRRLYYRYRDFNDETFVGLELVQVASAPEANDPTATSRRVDVDDPAYEELNARLGACRRCAEREDWIEASRRFEAAALDSGRTLDATLARIERRLGGCEREAPWPATIERAAKTDSAIAACIAGVSWRDSATAVAALARLERVNGRGLEKGYVLDYLRGRVRLTLGDVANGAYLMMGGLGGNPCMAGGWMDLGEGYLRGFQPVLAWICFEAAEQATAGNCKSRLEEKDRLERALEKHHPDFFE